MKKHIPLVLSVLVLGMLVLFTGHFADAKGRGGAGGGGGRAGGSSSHAMPSPDGRSTGPQVISRCGTTIRSSGAYQLTGDLNCTSGHGIDFTNPKAAGSTLDCHGHSILGQGDTMKRGAYVTAIGIYISQTDYLLIQNCVVGNFASAGILVNGSHIEIDSTDVRGSQTGIILNGSHNVLLNDTVHNNWNGLQMANSSFDNTVTNITADSNTNAGILAAQTSNDTISGTVLNNNYGLLIQTPATSVTAQNLNAHSNNIDGIYLSGVGSNVLDTVTAYGNGRYGIYFEGSSGNTLKDSVAYGNSARDIQTDSLMADGTANNTCPALGCYESAEGLGLCASFQEGSLGVGGCQIEYSAP